MSLRSLIVRLLGLSLALFAASFLALAPAFARAMPRPDVTKLLLEGSDPEYPEEARKRQEHGTGAFLLRTDIRTGRVLQVIVGQTTGHPLLDEAALKALHKWRFKPGALVHRDITKPRLNPPVSKDQCLVMVPVTF